MNKLICKPTFVRQAMYMGNIPFNRFTQPFNDPDKKPPSASPIAFQSINELRWEIRVPLWKNKLIRNQLCLAIGLPFGILIGALLYFKAYEGLILIGLLALLSGLFLFLVFRGTYDVRYVLDDEKIACHTQDKQKKRVRCVSTATALLGLFKGNASAVAIGIASGAGMDARIPWKRIRKVRYYDEGKTILLRAGFGEVLAVFCTVENCDEVTRLIREQTKGA